MFIHYKGAVFGAKSDIGLVIICHNVVRRFSHLEKMGGETKGKPVREITN